MVERLKNAKKALVGSKQTLKALESNEVKVVYLANDADSYVIAPIKKLCEEKNIETVYVDSMKQLGEYCGIEVGSASAALLQN